MNRKPTYYQTAALMVLFVMSLQANCLALDKSKYFGLKLFEFDALIGQSRPKQARLILTDNSRQVGVVIIQRIKTPGTAVENAKTRAKYFTAQGFKHVTEPTSGWFSDDDSKFEALSGFNDNDTHWYYRVMKSGDECYFISGNYSVGQWKVYGTKIRALIESFRFN
jgi:hypothetical protein